MDRTTSYCRQPAVSMASCSARHRLAKRYRAPSAMSQEWGAGHAIPIRRPRTLAVHPTRSARWPHCWRRPRIRPWHDPVPRTRSADRRFAPRDALTPARRRTGHDRSHAGKRRRGAAAHDGQRHPLCRPADDAQRHDGIRPPSGAGRRGRGARSHVSAKPARERCRQRDGICEPADVQSSDEIASSFRGRLSCRSAGECLRTAHRRHRRKIPGGSLIYCRASGGGRSGCCPSGNAT